MADELIPDYLMSDLADAFMRQMEQGDRMRMMMTGADPDNLPDLYVEHPLSPQFITARRDFVKRWKVLQKEGLAKGYLGYDHCYECAGTVIPTTETTEYLAEPNPDYDPDKPLPPLAQHVADGKPITFTYATKKIDI